MEAFDGPTRQAERAEQHADWQRSAKLYEEQRGLPHSEPDPDAAPEPDGVNADSTSADGAPRGAGGTV